MQQIYINITSFHKQPYFQIVITISPASRDQKNPNKNKQTKTPFQTFQKTNYHSGHSHTIAPSHTIYKITFIPKEKTYSKDTAFLSSTNKTTAVSHVDEIEKDDKNLKFLPEDLIHPSMDIYIYTPQNSHNRSN